MAAQQSCPCPAQHKVKKTDEIPRNGSGKILKRDLRKPFWEGRKSRV
jgi:hypothetical protein